MVEVRCPNCGKTMQWSDTIDVEGGLLEGWVLERMYFECPHCNKDYVTDVQVNITPDQLIFSEFIEND